MCIQSDLNQNVISKNSISMESSKSKPIIDEEVVCEVCRDGGWQEANKIVICDKCSVGVHQWCYGVTEIPEGDLPWFCDLCQAKEMNESDAEEDPICLLCNQAGGARKRGDVGKWLHCSCALAIPEVSFKIIPTLQSPSGFQGFIIDKRRHFLCEYCPDVGAVALQCFIKSCDKSFHVRCGMDNDCLFELRAQSGEKKSFCHKHRSHYFKYFPRNYTAPKELEVIETGKIIADDGEHSEVSEFNSKTSTKPQKPLLKRSRSRRSSTRITISTTSGKSQIPAEAVWSRVEQFLKQPKDEILIRFFNPKRTNNNSDNLSSILDDSVQFDGLTLDLENAKNIPEQKTNEQIETNNQKSCLLRAKFEINKSLMNANDLTMSANKPLYLDGKMNGLVRLNLAKGTLSRTDDVETNLKVNKLQRNFVQLNGTEEIVSRKKRKLNNEDDELFREIWASSVRLSKKHQDNQKLISDLKTKYFHVYQSRCEKLGLNLIQERQHATPTTPAKAQNILPKPQFDVNLIQTSRSLHSPSGSAAPATRKRSLVKNYNECQGGFREISPKANEFILMQKNYFESLDYGLPKVGSETEVDYDEFELFKEGFNSDAGTLKGNSFRQKTMEEQVMVLVQCVGPYKFVCSRS